MFQARQLSLLSALTVGLVPTTMATSAIAAESDTDPLQQGRWVAMGDSFQSGVGTDEYHDESGDCLRSPLSHVERLHEESSIGGELDFVACSGAVVEDLYSGRHDEPPQMDAVRANSDDISLVTVGIGGNDLDFAGNLVTCVTQGWVGRSCEERLDDEVTEQFEELTTADPDTGLNQLQRVYADIHDEVGSDSATVAGITYPKFFPPDGGTDWTSIGSERCNNIRVSDQLWINNWIQRLNGAIADAATSTGATPVDIYAASDGHELCNEDDNEDYLNGVRLDNNAFHPTEFGYRANTAAIGAELVPTPTPQLATRAAPPADSHEPPEARLEVEQDGDTITVDASGTTPGDAAPETFLWEFDDEELAEGETATHTYSEPGTYHLTLTVIDGNGEMGFSDAKEIVVE
ncbi:PKD domain-containing protein [Halostreptopolyspora alba]|uniref:PKD domain-containing protein n=1 Tax=Halostreptopolyspora alba TaxID=2487137 RepID=A0A3N0EB46_9ACTN|nr:PKD domain-containing protein [Nocardiopsaceae bacterium YIM 96095]